MVSQAASIYFNLLSPSLYLPTHNGLHVLIVHIAVRLNG